MLADILRGNARYIHVGVNRYLLDIFTINDRGHMRPFEEKFCAKLRAHKRVGYSAKAS